MSEEKDLKVLTLDEIEELEGEGVVEMELNDGEVKSVKTLTAAEAEKIKEMIKGMSEIEQQAVITVIKDVILWEEMNRRYLSCKDTVRRVYEALNN